MTAANILMPFLAALVALLGPMNPARAAELRIAVVSRTVFYVPLWVAEKKGFLATDQIIPRIEVYDNAERIDADLRAGKIDIAISTPESVIIDAYRGGSLRLIAANAQRLPHFIIARPHIKTLAQLRGARFGVLSLREGTTYLVRRLTETIGLAPDAYEIVAVGGAPTRWQLLREGQIDVGLQPFPLSYEAEAAGFTNLGPISDYVPDYLFTSVNVDGNWARANAGTISAFLRALRRGQDYVRANSAEAAMISAPELNSSVPLVARALSETERLRILSPDLSIAPRALAATFEGLKAVGLLPPDAALETTKFVDESYLARGR